MAEAALRGEGPVPLAHPELPGGEVDHVLDQFGRLGNAYRGQFDGVVGLIPALMIVGKGRLCPRLGDGTINLMEAVVRDGGLHKVNARG